MSKPKKNQTKKQKQRPTIGFFNLEIANDYALWPWQGIVDAAHQHDVNLVTFVGRIVAGRVENQANVLYDLARDSRLDGLIIWKAGLTMTLSETEVEKFCHQYNIPVVTLEGSLSGSPCVSYENYRGMRKAVDHLIEAHGYQKIGFLGMYDTENFRERYQGYVDAMTDHGLTIDPQLARPSFPKEQIRAAMITEPVLTDYLDHAAEVGMEAVIGVADSIAQQVQQKLQQRGVRVPEEVAVVGFDDFTEGRVLTPPLTTVMPSWYELGHRAAETLIDVLAGKSVPEMVTVPSVLKVRQSCGCRDAYVAAVTANPNHTPETLNLPEATTELVAMAQASELESIQGELQPLLETFTAELNSEKTGIFLKALNDALLRSMDSVEKLSHWHNIIAALRQQILPSLKQQDAETEQAETLLQQAQVLVSRVAERTQMSRNFRAGQKENNLREIGLSLITTLDVDTLTTTLANGLPGLDIPSCYLSLFENPQTYHYPDPAPEWSRLILAYNPQGRVELPSGGQRFPSHQLIPNELWPQDRACSFVLISLHFQKEQIGFALFESGSRQGKMYETLGTQISGALKGTLLMEQEEKRARQLQTVTEVGTATSTILDTAILLQKVVDLTKERFGLYHAHIYLLNDTGDTLDLVAGADETGRKMVAEGWHIPLNREQSLVARAARTRRGEVANDVQADAHWFANPYLPETKSEMAVPLLVGERVLGVLDVQSAELNHFTADDVRIQSTLATQVAVAMENAHLFAETTQSKEAAEMAKEKAEQARKEAETEKASAEAAREEAEQARKEAEAANQTLSTQMWQTTGQALLNERMRGEQDIHTLAANVINQLCEYLDVHAGMLYKLEGDELKLAGTYAYRRKDLVQQLKVGEKQAGQAALEKRIINVNIPDDYIANIYSILGDLLPKNILAAPFVYEGQVIGVVQMESLTEFTPAQLEFLKNALESMAIAFTTAAARAHVNELLTETRQQAEELQTQSEELRVANEELETQTKSLQTSEAALRDKQAILDQQNRELMVAQEELERKAKELALASKYKSEFLANMSHELRTPLNSLLILARMLADNKENNLTPEQIESAQIIHSGGTDLLNLINDILDLSKVEAGQMIFNFEAMSLADLVATVHMQFDQVAEEKGVELRINLSDDLPDRITTDPQRVKQIVKNLLSNAFKFTSQGSVSLDVYRPDSKVDLSRSGLDPTKAIAIRVADTGIGMTPVQLQVIFEAFQQADGSTSRQYGGTGLGLSISRELAANLGGQIDVTSEPGKGTAFTLYLPIAKEGVVAEGAEPSKQTQAVQPTKPATPQSDIPPTPKLPPPTDDRNDVSTPDERDETARIVAIIEDDPKFAKVVYNYAHKKGFKCLIAGEGQTGLELVRNYQPDAIILDLNLPDMSGWEVLTTLKNDPTMRHIPVHIMSVDDEDLNAFKKGAMGYLTKPISQKYLDHAFHEIEHFISQDIKSLLLVEDDANSRLSVKKLLDGNDVQISEAENGQQALDLLKSQPFDCMILDLSLPDMSGFEVLNKINDDDTIAKCPVIIYTGRELTPEENMELMQYADRVIVKGVKSPERLLDETALFLHRVVAEMPQEKQQTIKQLYNEDEMLKDKKVLVVDDDMRNSFALSKLLSDKGIKVQIAKDGQKALDLLDEGLEVDLILMDIMMPEMDGYETTKRIRAQRQFNGLPILALTAKAMKGDREKCLEAGANDYLPKPVDIDRLFSMLRVWLYQ